MKATTGAAQLGLQLLQWQKHAQIGWLLKLNATRPHRQCPSVALFMIAPIRMLFTVGGIICLSEGEGNPCAERAVVILAPAMQVCRTADKTGCLPTADRQTSLSGSSWHRSVP